MKLLYALAFLAFLTADLNAQAPPNIVIILADDLGYGDPGCYNELSKIPTPNIDQLAREGMRFTDAHSPSSVCTPTRYGLLTGRYCWRTKLKRSVLWPWDPPLIETKRLTLPRLLKQSGYQTACIGKWHLGWDWPLEDPENPDQYLTNEFDGFTIPAKQREGYALRIDWARAIRGGPNAYGFDYYFGDDVPNFPPYTFIENDRVVEVPTVLKPKKMFGHDGPASPDWDLSKVMPSITDRAVKFIDDYADSGSDKPFFLYVPLTAPHTPIAPVNQFLHKSQAGNYGDFVHQVDWTVGQVSTALERNGYSNNTLVFFASDNGSPQRNGTQGNSGPIGSVKKDFGHDPSRPWRGMKSDAWEAGHRIPFIARWPERIAANSESSEPVVLTDLMRTVAELVDYRLPLDAAEDSFDIGGVLLQTKRGKLPIRDHLIHHSGNGTFAIRMGDWKLILGRGSGGFTRFQPPADAPKGQLYNLDIDPAEQTNLYTAQPEVVSRLTKKLEEFQQAGRTFVE
jgi:arylsulfatase A-like enzyme